MPISNVYPNQVTLDGSYTGPELLEYQIRMYPNNTSSTFDVRMVNQDRTVQLQFQGGSTTVTVRQNDGDGTFSTHPTGIPIWVGDKIYETADTAQPNISGAANGYIGTVASIGTGTEGTSVTKFLLTNTTYLDQINSNDKVDALVDYKVSIMSVVSGVSSYQDDTEYYEHAKLYGLKFYFNTDFNGYAAPASGDTYLYWQFSGYPQKAFQAHKMIKLSKDGKTHIIGWNRANEKLSLLEDIYDETKVTASPPIDQTFLVSQPIEKEPTFVTRGDDTYLGLGPNHAPVYVGYPNIRQFGRDRGSELVVTTAAMNLDTSVLPSLEQYVMPLQGTQTSSLDLNLTLSASSQLVVGYVKGSSYLIKGSKSIGIESSIFVGGEILAIYLDHTVNDELWVLYDAVSHYGVKCIDIKDTTEGMTLHENRVYSLQGANDNQNWITPFRKDEVVPSDILFLDNRLYVSATDAEYDNPDKTPLEKCFGDGEHRQAFIWRSEDLTAAIGDVPSVGYTLCEMTDMTPTFTTEVDYENDQVAPFWYRWREESWWDTDDTGGIGGLAILDAGVTGNSGSLKIQQLPAKRGLCLYSNKTDEEGVGLLINYVRNSFGGDNDYISYNGGSDGNQNIGSSWEWKRVGPMIRQDGKNVALGSHIIFWEDSESIEVGNNTSSPGVKRIMINNSDKGITDSTLITEEPQGSGASAGDNASIRFYGSGSNWQDAHSVNTTINLVTSPQPRALSICYGNNLQWWNFVALNLGTLNGSDQDGLVFLNNSIDTKIFTPSETSGPMITAAQTWNYNLTGTKFSWLSVSYPSAFAMRYIDDVGNASVTGTSTWTEWDLLSTVKIGVTAGGSSEYDLNNLLPDAKGTDDDPPVYAEHTDYHKNFYKISLMLDGYQETVLGETVYVGSTNPNKYGHLVTVEVLASMLPPRLSHINLYRGKAWDGNATIPDLDYQLIKRIPLDGAGWRESTSGYIKYEVYDNKGKNYGSYEALTGISPEMNINHLAYEESEQCAGYLFVSNANNAEMANVGNYIFRSKAGKFSVFNWANEYVALPERPTALKSFKNLLFAFTNSAVYTINPNNLSIVDTMEGMGCLDPVSVIATDFGMFFADKNGVYQHNGRQGQVISQPIFTSDYSSLENFTWDSIGTSLETNPPKLGFDGQRKALFIVFDVGGVSYAWVYSVGAKRWDLWSFSSPILSLTQGKYGDILASDGKLSQIGTSPTRKPWEFVSKKMTAGFDTYEKSFTEVHVEGGNGLTTKYKTSGIGTYQTLTSNRIASAYKKAKWLQVQVVDDAGTREMESIGIHLRPLKAKSSKV
tara:strand:- start:1787 stop:5707 length:3921 start_codon:yes stop_codon:yes gene_type:complete